MEEFVQLWIFGMNFSKFDLRGGIFLLYEETFRKQKVRYQVLGIKDLSRQHLICDIALIGGQQQGRPMQLEGGRWLASGKDLALHVLYKFEQRLIGSWSRQRNGGRDRIEASQECDLRSGRGREFLRSEKGRLHACPGKEG